MTAKETKLYKTLRVIACSVAVVIIILFVLYAILIGFAWLGVQPERKFNKEITAIACESDEIPFLSAYATVYKEEKAIKLFNLCEKRSMDYENALCVFENRVYFLCTEQDENENRYWNIASTDFEGRELQIHFQFKNPNTPYNRLMNGKAYNEQNGFSTDGKIILNDFTSVWEYDLWKATAEKFAFSDYDFPKKEAYGEYIDGENLKLITKDGETPFSFEEFCKDSTGLLKIYSYKDKQIWDDTSATKNFFGENSIQCINGKIYAVCECLERSGGAYAVVAVYDEPNEQWNYVTSVYIWDSADDAYLIPEYQ